MSSIEDINIHEAVVTAVVPEIYDYVATLQPPGVGLYNDMSHSNKCSIMTRLLLDELRARHLVARRELHETPDGWHFVIVHALSDDEPSRRDIMTDLNPWQYGPANKSGYLHGTRDDVSKTLAQAGVPIQARLLRSIQTVTVRHTFACSPADAYSELP